MKIILCILFFFLSISNIYGDQYLLLNAKTAVGVGTDFIVYGSNPNNWTCDVWTTGNPTAVTVRVEGNINSGSSYTSLGMAQHSFSSTELSEQRATFSIANKTANKLRGYLVTLTGGSSPSVSMLCEGVL